jgi:hypothetical protein
MQMGTARILWNSGILSTFDVAKSRKLKSYIKIRPQNLEG